jgi:hypothetical protein
LYNQDTIPYERGVVRAPVQQKYFSVIFGVNKNFSFINMAMNSHELY